VIPEYPQKSSAGRIVRILFVGAILLLCALGIAFLALDVSRKIAAQATANSDNIQWSLSQIDVELLSLHTAIAAANHGAGTLDQVRSRFDVFYSRATTFKTSDVFAILHQNADYMQGLEETWAFLDRTTPLIDGPDDVLAAKLEQIEQDVAKLHGATRTIAMTGIKVFAEKADGERAAVTRTLTEVAALTLVLIALLVGLVWVLMRVDRQNQGRARENQMTLARMEAVVASALDAVIVVDGKGTVLEFNTSAELISGFTRQEAVGANLTELIVPDHMIAAHTRGLARYRASARTTKVGRGRLRMEAKRRDGTLFPVELSISRAWSDQGEIFVSYLRDVTEQVAAERELLRARDTALAAAKAKSDLLAVMSHEMRTPLNGMIGTIELMGDTELTKRQRGLLQVMETSGRLLLHHVNDVLDISRLDSGKMQLHPERVDLAHLIDEIFDNQRALAATNGNDLQASLPPAPQSHVICDPMQLRQVLLNLVGNANKFTKNGKIRVEVLPVDDEGMTEFRVIDTGIGIASDEASRIFEDFVTLDASYARSSGGTGLGLGISRRIVQNMGGSIAVESSLGEGSVFRVRVPLQPAPEIAPLPDSLPNSASGQVMENPMPAAPDQIKRLQILVVEDNPINRLVVREMLQAQGHNVHEAHDGEDGVQAAATHRFDVILMDISMPRMDGLEATRAIRASSGKSHAVPIIALTAHALEAEVTTFLAAGMQLVLNKPVSGKALAKSLKEALSMVPTPALTTPAAPASGLVDADLLAELFETLGAERGGDMLAKFLTATDAELPGLVARIVSGTQALADSQREVHKLAGAAAIFGAKALNGALRAMETACKAGDAAALIPAAQGLPSLWAQSREALVTVQQTESAKG
jgi:PAS domain S-box-containing protein